jgi:Domain of unknown function (DUF4412)
VGRDEMWRKMMRRMTSWACGFIPVLLLILMFQECVAGVVIEQVVRDREGNASKVIMYFSESRFRSDHPNGGLTTIIDFKEDRMVMIDHISKHYVEVKFSQWEREIAERLKKAVPDTQPKSRKIVIKKVDETSTLNGFRTEKVQIIADGELIEENWVTRDVAFEEVEKVMDKVALGFSKEFKTEMQEGREIYEKIKAFGFPILVKDYSITQGLGGVDVLEVKKIEKKELKNEVFLPPKGYQRIFPESSKK